MVRLILLTAPIGSIFGGIAAGRVLAWCVSQWMDEGETAPEHDPKETPTSPAKTPTSSQVKKRKKIKVPQRNGSKSDFDTVASVQHHMDGFLKSKEGVYMKRGASILLVLTAYFMGGTFVRYCWRLAQDLANPTIIQRARLRDGSIIKLDDYREGYWWIRDNTPEDARIMAWWDCR